MRSSSISAGQSGLASQYNNLRDDAYGGSMLLAHEQGTANMTLYVEPGVCYIGTTRVIFGGGNSPSFTAPTTNPRIDILTLDSSGTLAITQGTEASSPSAPSYPTNKVVICEVYNVVGETAIYDNDAQVSGQGYILNDTRPLNTPVYISDASQVASGLFIPWISSPAQGDVAYYNGSAWVRLPAGTSGQFLQTKGSSANPQWASVATVVATGSASGTAYSVSANTSPGSALDTTNLKIVFTGAVGQIVRITAYAAAQVVVAANQGVGVYVVDTTNSVSVGQVCGGATVTNGTYQIYGLMTFYYTLKSTTTTFEMYGYNQSGSNTFTVYNPSANGFVPTLGVAQSVGGSTALLETLSNTDIPWFVIEAI